MFIFSAAHHKSRSRLDKPIQRRICNMFNLQHFLDKISLHPFSIFLLLICLIYLCKWVHKNNLIITPKKLPPSPPRLPIIGNLHQLGTAPHRSLESLSRKYGELMLLHLGNTPTLVVSSSKAAREIMKTHDVIFSNRPYSRKISKLVYGSKDVAFSIYGDYWRQMKSICVLQLLSSSRVRSFGAIREEEMTIMVEKIRRSTPEAVNLSEILVTLTNDVICRAAFGRKYSGKESSDFKELTSKFVELLGVLSVRDFVPWLGWIDDLSGLDKKIEKLAREFDIFLERVLEDHIDGLKNEGNGYKDDNGEKVKDFVDVLLEAQRDDASGPPIDRDSIKAIILDMFSAGTDTTYSAMEWAMSELIRHPKVLNKLQEEVRSITQGKNGIDEDDLEKMLYLKAVIKETFRLHPPVPLLVFRESTQDVKINGYDIAAKTQVITNAWAIQRDPCSWEDPDVFCPERFLTCAVDFKGHDFQLIPFGAGRRICPGILFATVNIELVLANLMYEFDWALPDGPENETLDMEESSGMTIHRRNPLIAIATPRCCE